MMGELTTLGRYDGADPQQRVARHGVEGNESFNASAPAWLAGVHDLFLKKVPRPRPAEAPQ